MDRIPNRNAPARSRSDDKGGGSLRPLTSDTALTDEERAILDALDQLPAPEPDADLINVLTTDQKSAPIGYRLGGHFPGPSVLVAGHDPVAGQVFERLMAIPTLGWMHGTLTLIYLDLVEQEGLNAHIGTLIDRRPDELFFLPYQTDPAFQTAAVTDGYWSVLRLCTKLGLIAGRGVPTNSNNQPI